MSCACELFCLWLGIFFLLGFRIFCRLGLRNNVGVIFGRHCLDIWVIHGCAKRAGLPFRLHNRSRFWWCWRSKAFPSEFLDRNIHSRLVDCRWQIRIFWVVSNTCWCALTHGWVLLVCPKCATIYFSWCAGWWRRDNLGSKYSQMRLFWIIVDARGRQISKTFCRVYLFFSVILCLSSRLLLGVILEFADRAIFPMRTFRECGRCWRWSWRQIDFIKNVWGTIWWSTWCVSRSGVYSILAFFRFIQATFLVCFWCFCRIRGAWEWSTWLRDRRRCTDLCWCW